MFESVTFVLSIGVAPVICAALVNTALSRPALLEGTGSPLMVPMSLSLLVSFTTSSATDAARVIAFVATVLPENVLRTPPKKLDAPVDDAVGVVVAPSEPGLPFPYALALSRTSLPIPHRFGVFLFGGGKEEVDPNRLVTSHAPNSLISTPS